MNTPTTVEEGQLQRIAPKEKTAIGMRQRVLVSGATGLIGSAVVAALKADGCEVVALTRRAGTAPNGVKEIVWRPMQDSLNPELIDGFSAVVHLAGESIMGRWTEKKKKAIVSSRVDRTWALAEALAKAKEHPRALICASAVGYYGDQGDMMIRDPGEAGTGFLPEVCAKWENAVKPALRHMRVVHLRLGVVLSKRGGALKQMLPVFRWGLGGTLGNGKQWMSWIALDDVVSIIRRAIDDDELAGPINVVSPNPVTNAEFTKSLGKVLRRPAFFRVPRLALALMYGRQMVDETLLSSTRAIPFKLQQAGHEFLYPELRGALQHELLPKAKS